MSGQKKNRFDITKLSVDELKKIATDDLLTYIEEFEDKKKIIIYLIKIIQQNGLHPNEIVHYRTVFINLEDLEDKLILIHKIIADNGLCYDNNLANELREMEKKLSRLKYKNLKKITDLEQKNKIMEHKISLELYNKTNEEIRLLFFDICELYEYKLSDIEDRNTAKQDAIDLLLSVWNTPNMPTDVPIGQPFEQIIQERLERAGLINRQKTTNKIKEINDAKAKKFYEDQEKLKKERGRST